MKKLISRVLTLVVIAGTISNTTHCLFPRGQVTQTNRLHKKLVTANTAVAAGRDLGKSVEEQKKAEETAKKAADEARSHLDSVKGMSTSAKLLVTAIATTGALLTIDYALAAYTEGRMGGYTTAGLGRAREFYTEKIQPNLPEVKRPEWTRGWKRPAWLGGVPVENASAKATMDAEALGNIATQKPNIGSRDFNELNY